MKFLLQTVEGRVRHDFVFEMEHAIDYQRWRGNEVDAVYCSLEEVRDGCTSLIDSDEVREYVPIGTIEFVHSFIDKFIKEDGSKELKPLNVPEVLFGNAGGEIANCALWNKEGREETYRKFNGGADVFVKSNGRIKDPINGQYRVEDILDEGKIPNGNYQVRSRIDIVSEYRCFVYNRGLLGVHYYSGQVDVFPNAIAIHRMVSDYSKDGAPKAWTLDVGVTGRGETVAIECHEFYSCGLYGFSDYNALPYMFYRVFKDLKNFLAKK